jgi:hypothetical protein
MGAIAPPFLKVKIFEESPENLSQNGAAGFMHEFFERGAPRPFQKNSYPDSALPQNLLKDS